jgi:hypothetical protein
MGHLLDLDAWDISDVDALGDLFLEVRWLNSHAFDSLMPVRKKYWWGWLYERSTTWGSLGSGVMRHRSLRTPDDEEAGTVTQQERKG